MTAPDTVFETSRLQARRLHAGDVDALVQVYGDADAMRFVGDGQPLPRSACERWVGVTLENYRLRGYGMFALVLRAGGEVAGFCGLVHPGGQPVAELKYALARAHWGRGLATEAAAGLLAWGAAVAGLREAMATVVPAHVASQRVLLKAGMQRGALRDNGDGSHTQMFHWQAPTQGPARWPGQAERR
ncbi:MAG: GNAT family N-acetyltransferase [Aquabacterium sp.]